MARILSKERVLSYSNEFKFKVVNLTNIEGMQIKQIAEGLGLHPLMVSRWRKEVRDGKLVPDDTGKVHMGKAPKHPPKKRSTEIDRLKKTNARLKKENDLLKKWQRYLKETRAKDSDS